MALTGVSRTDEHDILPNTAFGELSVAENTPQVQIKFPHGVIDDEIEAFANKVSAGSAITSSNGTVTVTCANVADAFCQIRARDVIRYGPGQGARARFTAGFSGGTANSTLFAGAGDDDEAIGVGYSGTRFGFRHLYFGELEVRELQITSAADAGGGDFVITLDGVATTITVGAAATIPEIVAAIVATSFLDKARGWEVFTGNADVVEFVSLVAENAAGTFSAVDTDSGVTFGTFEQATTTVLGVAPTEHFTAQEDWDDPCDGTGASGINLSSGADTTLPFSQALESLNVWDIPIQYLGGGNIVLKMENKETGKFTPVHMMKHAGANGGTGRATFRNTTFNLTLIAKTETGYRGGTQTVKTASMGGFIEGQETTKGLRHSVKNTKTTNGTTLTSVMLIHNDIKFQSTRNKTFVYPDLLTFASEATKTVTLSVIKNPTQVAGSVSYANVDSANSAILQDTAGTTITGGEEILTFTQSGAGSQVIDLKALNLFLRPVDVWAFGMTLSSGSDAPVTVGLSWLERL